MRTRYYNNNYYNNNSPSYAMEDQMFEKTNTNLFSHGKLLFKYKEKIAFDNNKDTLSTATRNNLNHLEKLNIKWKEIYVQKVFRYDRWSKAYKQVNSLLITGSCGSDQLLYLRKETKSPGAGQTSLYLNHDKIQMTSILALVKEKDFDDFVRRTTITKAEAISREHAHQHYSKSRVLSEQWIKFLGKNLYQTKEDTVVGLFDDNNVIREIATARIKQES